MAKKKKTGKPAAKGKARSEKLSVKKQPVKDLDARKAKSPKGGITGNKPNVISSLDVKYT